ncbi:MAG: hypothetical protein JNL87_10740 [Burkholderiaceae bacterium]|nr:hypothetical protein [Burkholderiaceae bacterium]
MTTRAPSLFCPWHRRLFEAIGEAVGAAAGDGLGRPRRGPAGRDELLGLDRHLLADIGVDPGLIEALAEEQQQRTLVLRLHSLGGF